MRFPTIREKFEACGITGSIEYLELEQDPENEVELRVTLKDGKELIVTGESGDAVVLEALCYMIMKEVIS